MQRSGPELSDELRAILRSLKATDDPADVWRLTVRFHGVVVDGAASPRIKVVLRAMPGMIPGNFFALVPGSVESEKKGFAAIVRAVTNGDGPKAAAEYAKTMRAQGERVVRVLADRGLLDDPLA